MKLDRITGNANVYINTFDIEEFPKIILFEKPDMIIVTADGAYGKDCVNIAKEINNKTPLFFIRRPSGESQSGSGCRWSRTPLASDFQDNADKRNGTAPHRCRR